MSNKFEGLKITKLDVMQLKRLKEVADQSKGYSPQRQHFEEALIRHEADLITLAEVYFNAH